MYEKTQSDLEKEIKQQQTLFEKALDEGTEFGSLKKIWLNLKSLQEQWRHITSQSR
jgi:hypothetical protein